MPRPAGIDLFETPEGRQMLADRKFQLDSTSDAFAERFTRLFLHPRKRILITVTHLDSGDRFVLPTTTGDVEAEFDAFTDRFGDDARFEVNVYDGRVLFGGRS